MTMLALSAACLINAHPVAFHDEGTVNTTVALSAGESQDQLKLDERVKMGARLTDVGD